MDRDRALDIQSYVLREYDRIKQNNESEEMFTLLYLVAVERNVSVEAVKIKVVQCLDETDSPVEFIGCIKEAF